ncbi:MAG: glycosyltransferase family 2 protein [Treponema sp.]|nr:glycosyltransferase family 2 protein [Treponema sp.]
MDNPKIGLVTVLYNGEKVVEDFFYSLNTQVYKNFVLYVIDNKSTDDCLNKSRLLSKNCFFETKFIPNDGNYGVAKGNNQGIIAALQDGCDYVLLCNNDIVLKEDTIKVLVDAMIPDEINLVVPKIYFYDSKRLWFAGGKFKKIPGSIQHKGYGEIDIGRYNKQKIIDYAPTCFMMIKKEVFFNTGIMDEKYFVYFDDTDFIYRAVHKNGNTLLYCPNTSIEHKESYSTGGVKSDFGLKYYYRNKVYFIKKHFKNYKFFYFINRCFFILKKPIIGKDLYSKIKASLVSGLKM